MAQETITVGDGVRKKLSDILDFLQKDRALAGQSGRLLITMDMSSGTLQRLKISFSNNAKKGKVALSIRAFLTADDWKAIFELEMSPQITSVLKKLQASPLSGRELSWSMINTLNGALTRNATPYRLRSDDRTKKQHWINKYYRIVYVQM